MIDVGLCSASPRRREPASEPIVSSRQGAKPQIRTKETEHALLTYVSDIFACGEIVFSVCGFGPREICFPIAALREIGFFEVFSREKDFRFGPCA